MGERHWIVVCAALVVSDPAAAANWQTVAASDGPVALQSARETEARDDGTRSVTFTFQNTGGVAVDEVQVVTRVFGKDGRRKGAFIFERALALPAHGGTELVVSAKRMSFMGNGDVAVATVGFARYGARGARQEWRLRKGEENKLALLKTPALAGEVRVLEPTPDLPLHHLRAVRELRGLRLQAELAGAVQPSGLRLSMSCSCKDWECTITCSGSDSCC